MEEKDLHVAVREGRLAEYLTKNPETGNAILYRTLSELVYKRLTQPAERARGHRRCAVSVEHLEPECHDRHQDDVEALRADLLRHADLRIGNLQGWLLPRLRLVTVDAHRRRRGAVGAMQRPRLPLPGWLNAALGGDAWLSTLAIEILAWVGVQASVPGGTWPLSAWAERHAQVTGEVGRTEGQVAGDVERVLAAMRTNPDWYGKYIERPLGRKQAPTALRPRNSEDREHLLALRFTAQEVADARLAELAAEAIAAIEKRIGEGQELNSAVVEVLGGLFGRGYGIEEMDQAPGGGSDADERMAQLLADPEAVDRLVRIIYEVIRG